MPTTMKLIAKNVLGSAASNVEFTSIPGTYTDLYVVGSIRTTRSNADPGADCNLTFNGSTSGFSWRTLSGDGASAGSGNNGAGTSSISGFLNVSSFATANTFGSWELYIPNYAGSTNKSVSIASVSETNGTTAFIRLVAGLWANASAITSLNVADGNSSNFVSGSSVFLFGITKA